MSVMDMLAVNEAAEAAAKNGPAGGGKAKSGKGKGKGKANGGGTTNESNIRTAPASEVSSTADASGDEVDAMDEDMMADDGDESEEDSDEEEEEDEDEDEQHARLLGFVGTLGEQAAAAHQAAEDRRSSQLLKEGEFNPTAVAASSGAGSAKRGAITMEVREEERKGGSREGPLVIRASLVAPFVFFSELVTALGR